MKKREGFKLGLTGGIIISLIYMVLIWAKYTFFSFSPFAFFLSNYIVYGLIIIGFFLLAIKRRNQLGGYAHLQELFQPIFISILVIELTYVLFTYVYLNKINPTFFDQFKESTVAFMKEQNFPIENQEKKLSDIDYQKISSSNLWSMAKSLLPMWIIIDSIIGFGVSFFCRKKSPDDIRAKALNDMPKF